MITKTKTYFISDTQRDYDYLDRLYTKLYRAYSNNDYDEGILIQREHKDLIDKMERKYNMSIGKYTSIFKRISNLKNKVKKSLQK